MDTDENVSAEAAQSLLDSQGLFMGSSLTRLARTVIALHAALDAENEASGVVMERLGEVAMERDEARRTIATLYRQREGHDCRFAGAFAEVSGTHCPPGRRCVRCQADEARDQRDRLALIIFGAWSDIEHTDCWDDPRDGIKQAHAALWSVVREGRRQKAADAAHIDPEPDAD